MSKSKQSTRLRLHPYQLNAVNYIVNRPKQHGLILNFTPGSGKTFTGLAFLKNYPDKKHYIIIPKSLENRWIDDNKKVKAQIEFIMYDEFASAISSTSAFIKLFNKLNNAVCVFDEAHLLYHIFNHLTHETGEDDEDEEEANNNKPRKRKKKHPEPMLVKFIELFKKPHKLLLLTGTIIRDKQLSDIRWLINIAAGKTLVPFDKSEFEEHFLYLRPIDYVLQKFINPLIGYKPRFLKEVVNKLGVKKYDPLLEQVEHYRTEYDYEIGEVEYKKGRKSNIYDTVRILVDFLGFGGVPQLLYHYLTAEKKDEQTINTPVTTPTKTLTNTPPKSLDNLPTNIISEKAKIRRASSTGNLGLISSSRSPKGSPGVSLIGLNDTSNNNLRRIYSSNNMLSALEDNLLADYPGSETASTNSLTVNPARSNFNLGSSVSALSVSPKPAAIVAPVVAPAVALAAPSGSAAEPMKKTLSQNLKPVPEVPSESLWSWKQLVNKTKEGVIYLSNNKMKILGMVVIAASLVILKIVTIHLITLYNDFFAFDQLDYNKLKKVGVNKYIAYYNSEDNKEFYPEIIRKTYRVPYTTLQLRLLLRFFVIHDNLTPNEYVDLEMFHSAQEAELFKVTVNDYTFKTNYTKYGKKIGNLYKHPEKFYNIAKIIIKYKKSTVIYSNYYERGILLLSDYLKHKKIKHVIYDHTLSNTQKNNILNGFKDGKIKVILLHPDFYQGVNILGCQHLHILEPVDNYDMYEQLIRRVVRYKSHWNLPKSQRKVTVFEWSCTLYYDLNKPKHIYYYYKDLATHFNTILQFIDIFKEWISPDDVSLSKHSYISIFYNNFHDTIKKLSVTDNTPKSSYNIWLPPAQRVLQKKKIIKK